MAEGYLGSFKYGGTSTSQNAKVDINIPTLSEDVDGFERWKLLDEIWFEVKNMTRTMQIMTNLLVKMNSGIDKDIFKVPDRDEEPDGAALAALEKVLYGDSSDEDSKPFNASEVQKQNTATAAEQHQALIEALSQIFTGKPFSDVEGTDNNISDMTSQVMTGKKYDDIKETESNISDMTSKVITGKKYDDLELEKEGGESGEYDTTLNGRIHKTTEMLSGMLVGLFTEDEIKAKLEATDIDKLSSIEENLGGLDEKASFMKNMLNRDSNFTLDDGDTHNRSNQLSEIERALKALVLSYVHGDLKGELKMSIMRGQPFPENIPEEFWNDLKHAYAKFSGDFTRTINDLDVQSTDDDHTYGDMNITDTES
jgi:hypothetical protein